MGHSPGGCPAPETKGGARRGPLERDPRPSRPLPTRLESEDHDGQGQKAPRSGWGDLGSPREPAARCRAREARRERLIRCRGATRPRGHGRASATINDFRRVRKFYPRSLQGPASRTEILPLIAPESTVNSRSSGVSSGRMFSSGSRRSAGRLDKVSTPRPAGEIGADKEQASGTTGRNQPQRGAAACFMSGVYAPSRSSHAARPSNVVLVAR
jgi:hypothetical protein